MAEIIVDIPGITGECTISGYEKKIMCTSMSLNAAQEVERTANQTRTVHRVKIEDITLNRFYDSSSTGIMDMLVTGRTADPVTITVLKSGADTGGEAQKPLMTITLNKVLIASQNVNFGETELTEEFTFNFTKVTYTYYPQQPDGTLKGTSTTNFDLQLGKKV